MDRQSNHNYVLFSPVGATDPVRGDYDGPVNCATSSNGCYARYTGRKLKIFLLRQGKITGEEFIENSEVVCLDVTISAIASLIGQVAIPIPVLGAVVGNAVGMFMYGIAKNNLSMREQQLISGFNESINSLNAKLDERYRVLIDLLKREFAKFQSVVALAFDLDVNIAFAGSMVAINAIFKFDVSKDALKSLATAAVGVGGATIVGKTIVSNLLKFIPGVGSGVGCAISAATAGLITLALGKAYIEMCKAIKMGNLDQSDLTKKAGVDALKAAFKEQLKNKK